MNTKPPGAPRQCVTHTHRPLRSTPCTCADAFVAINAVRTAAAPSAVLMTILPRDGSPRLAATVTRARLAIGSPKRPDLLPPHQVHTRRDAQPWAPQTRRTTHPTFVIGDAVAAAWPT